VLSGSAISIKGLRKRYGDKQAVDGLDLEIAPGEVFALLGPNGAGKTTTVEILEGYRERDSGDVTVLDTDPHHGGRAWRSRIGIVAQTSGDSPELSVEELVRHFARYFPNPRDPDEVINAVGLDDKRRSRTRQLSGGQRRRLDVALGVVGNPEVLFLDEPTTGFDPEARRQFWTLIEGLQTGGTTILLTTHYLDEAEHLADRVGVIADGRLVELGTPSTLGGRGARAARVRWVDADGPHEERTHSPSAVVARLLEHFGGEIPELEVRRPSLEDIYIDLIGQSHTEAPATSSDSPAPPNPTPTSAGCSTDDLETGQLERELA
jgi:ABC-2 type transport system ATP-binding protein